MTEGVFIWHSQADALRLRELLTQTATPGSWQALQITRIDAALAEERSKRERRRRCRATA